MTTAYRRLLLKLSGEGLAGEGGFGIHPGVIAGVAEQIGEVHELGVQISLVIGGGNIVRGLTVAAEGIERAQADYMGMLSSVINAMALQDALEKRGVPTRVQSAIEIAQVAETYIRRRAMRHLEKGRIVIFAAGTGNPFFTTDSAACLRGIEVEADAVFKATKVDGVYDSDPVTNPEATKYDRLAYDEVLEKKLGVMDLTAICLCRDHDMPVRVFNMNQPGSLLTVTLGGEDGTLIEKG